MCVTLGSSPAVTPKRTSAALCFSKSPPTFPHASFCPVPLFSAFLSMTATSDGPWVCPECGKVCKSCSGLTRHSLVHKRNVCVGQPHENLYRIYHPTFDGMLLFSLTKSLLTLFIRNTLSQRWGVSPTWDPANTPTFKTRQRLEPFHLTRQVRTC